MLLITFQRTTNHCVQVALVSQSLLLFLESLQLCTVSSLAMTEVNGGPVKQLFDGAIKNIFVQISLRQLLTWPVTSRPTGSSRA